MNPRRINASIINTTLSDMCASCIVIGYHDSSHNNIREPAIADLLNFRLSKIISTQFFVVLVFQVWRRVVKMLCI